jgi:phasin
MADEQKSGDEFRNALADNLKKAKAAADNYFDMVEKSLGSSPLPFAEHAKAFRTFLRQSIDQGFDLSAKLLVAKDVQEVVRIQSEFFQGQLNALNEQARSVGESAAKAASGAFKLPQGD